MFYAFFFARFIALLSNSLQAYETKIELAVCYSKLEQMKIDSIVYSKNNNM